MRPPNRDGEQSVSIVAMEAPANPRSCIHRGVEELGHEGGVAFLRCEACGSILIVHKAHRWIIRPTDVQGPIPF